ncbi:hypothetical protein PPSIR1_05223 [Plesiocystis pacifica SIR-1]|uniref:Uncharacterized protein n=1 Tax=Plesiocystis pacifica SIR-1 TaxID=391625 RepID=A6FX17_9BACT|nr:hypothetical protein PPSIR1_05223 [Plesiocystis pacifica SIR-1]
MKMGELVRSMLRVPAVATRGDGGVLQMA